MDVGRRKRVVSLKDMEVFQRAYRLSLDIHRWSLHLPQLEACVGRSDAAASKSICANVAEGYGRQTQSKDGVQALSADGDRLERRDAGVDAVRVRLGYPRRECLAAMAGRISGGDADAAEAARQPGMSSVVGRLDFLVLRCGSGAFRRPVKGDPRGLRQALEVRMLT